MLLSKMFLWHPHLCKVSVTLRAGQRGLRHGWRRRNIGMHVTWWICRTEGADILMGLSGLHQTLDLVGQSGSQFTMVISYVSPRWCYCESNEEIRGVPVSEMHR